MQHGMHTVHMTHGIRDTVTTCHAAVKHTSAGQTQFWNAPSRGITHYKAGRWDKRGRIWSGSVCEHFTHGWPAPVSVAASQLFWSGITSALWPLTCCKCSVANFYTDSQGMNGCLVRRGWRIKMSMFCFSPLPNIQLQTKQMYITWELTQHWVRQAAPSSTAKCNGSLTRIRGQISGVIGWLFPGPAVYSIKSFPVPHPTKIPSRSARVIHNQALWLIPHPLTPPFHPVSFGRLVFL